MIWLEFVLVLDVSWFRVRVRSETVLGLKLC